MVGEPLESVTVDFCVTDGAGSRSSTRKQRDCPSLTRDLDASKIESKKVEWRSTALNVGSTAHSCQFGIIRFNSFVVTVNFESRRHILANSSVFYLNLGT